MRARALSVVLAGAALLLAGDASGAPGAPAGTVTFLAGDNYQVPDANGAFHQ